jgi:hypothetical protein
MMGTLAARMQFPFTTEAQRAQRVTVHTQKVRSPWQFFVSSVPLWWLFKLATSTISNAGA